jgi:hypothetical protein
MNIFDFLTQDEIEDAPEDGALAFAYLVRIAQARLTERMRGLDARGFMSTVISLGKSYAIEPFAGLEMPRFENFDYNVHRQFKADLDHYMAQLVVGNALRGRRESIRLAPEAKERIRTHLHHIKDHLDKAEITDAKRSMLHAKLAEFEAALEKNRLNVFAAGRVVIEILSLTANVAGLADSATLHKLLSNVMVTVAEAKATDDESRKLPPFAPPPVLLPPRRSEPKPKKPPRESFEDFSADIDDEIPF